MVTGTRRHVNGLDVPIVRLVPRNQRKVSDKYRKRIEASLRAVGLIEPFVVFPLGDDYEILDGGLRYEILLNLGVETVPCLIVHSSRRFHRQPHGQPAQPGPGDPYVAEVSRGTWTRRRSPTPWGSPGSGIG